MSIEGEDTMTDKIGLAQEQLKIATELRIAAHMEGRALTPDEDKIYKNAVKVLLGAYESKKLKDENRGNDLQANAHNQQQQNNPPHYLSGIGNNLTQANREAYMSTVFTDNNHMPLKAGEVAEYKKKSLLGEIAIGFAMFGLGFSVGTLILQLIKLFG